MLHTIRSWWLCLLILVGVIVLTPRAAQAAEPADQLATFILKSASADQGLCLVIDANDGALTASLAKGSRLYVQGCNWETTKLHASRQSLVTAGVAERASITSIEVNYLPYADNLINLLVSASWGQRSVDLAEVLRVLAPGGVGMLGNDGNPEAITGLAEQLKQAGVKEVKALARQGWLSFVKPPQPDFGTWTHNSGGPDLSFVGDDKVAGPWAEVRWIGAPRWGALAETYSGRVTGGGRIYYAETRSDGGWWMARDAYNGTELWRFPLEGKGWVPLWGPGNTLACDDRWAFATHQGTLTARDGKTGKIVQEYKLSVTPRNITSLGEVLLVSDPAKNMAFGTAKNKGIGAVVAVEKTTGRVAWTRPVAVHPPAAEGVAFVLNATELEGVKVATGDSLWKTPITKADGDPRVFCKDGIVYVVTQPNWKPPSQLTAFDAKSGKLLWTDTTVCAKAGVPLPIGAELYFTMQGKEQRVLVMDARTGKVVREIPIKGLNGKCYGLTGCGNYINYGNCTWLEGPTGVELTQTTVRSPCFLGSFSANGLTYYLPHHCDCHVTLRGFLAMSRPGSRQWLPANAKDGSPRLFTVGGAPAPAVDKPDDWPMYRNDPRRSNSTPMKLPEQLQPLWTVKLGDSHLTQAVLAYGISYVAEPQTHRVFARDAATGKELWSFVADGRVDYPPALHRGLCLFGTSGGSVYGLDARTGLEIWRLRAAPTEKYIAEEGQFASAWPVIGGVMPMNGEIYFTCGRSISVDGGLWLFAVEATTGKVRWRTRGGASGDLVLSDGKELYLTKTYYHLNNGTRVLGSKTPSGILRTTNYLTPVAISDYTACVEPSLSSQKHIELTDGQTTGESLAFNDQFGVAAWRYRFGVPAAMMKQNLTNQRFIYAKAGNTVKWLLDEDIKQQMVAMLLSGDIAYAAGLPTSLDPKSKSELWVLSGADGKRLQTITLPGRPVYDGLSAAGGRLYLATEDGMLTCFGARQP